DRENATCETNGSPISRLSYGQARIDVALIEQDQPVTPSSFPSSSSRRPSLSRAVRSSIVPGFESAAVINWGRSHAPKTRRWFARVEGEQQGAGRSPID